MNMEHTPEIDPRLVARVERTREALNATKWWQLFKRHDAAAAHKVALLQAAYAEIDAGLHRVTRPASTDAPTE